MKRFTSAGSLRAIAVARLSRPYMVLVVGVACCISLGERLHGEERLQYNRDILPILAEQCFTCHGADSAARKADLRLDRRDAALELGAIVAGQPDDSELIARIMTDDADEVMPPPRSKKTLTAKQKQLLHRWIQEGAEYQQHWSLLGPTRPAVPPAEKAWGKNAIDRFILQRLQAVGLRPAPEAAPPVLFRRLHLDITGLPPSPQDVQTFVADYTAHGDEALSAWIDRLMQTKGWGEHRARYWLDAARYGDTHGLHFDNYREMWPYRDWVIRAFNANQPFDQFTVEQLAGDLLPNPTDDQLVATGFQRCNITTNEGGTIDEENLANYAADRVQTFGWVYLGLTTNCSQCHDHKFDPLTQKDYYSLAAFFRNTTQGAKDGNVKDGRGPVITVPTEADRRRWLALPAEIAQATQARDARRVSAKVAFQQWLAAVSPKTLEADVAAEQLVVHAPLNEGEGNEARNLCGQPATFQAVGKVKWEAGGKLGPAPVMQAGGTFELGELGDFERDQEFSYGAWIKAGRTSVFGAILARMDERDDYRGWDLWQNDRSFGVHIISAWPDNGLKVVTVDAVMQPNAWQHVFVTYDGSGKPAGIKLYVDGKESRLKVETNTLQPQASIRTKTPLRIGQRSHSQLFAGGAIQDVRVYRTALAASEVQTLAKLAPLRTILATQAGQRTPQQEATLFDYYLATEDQAYSELAKAVVRLQAESAAIKGRSPVTHVQRERNETAAMAYILQRGAYDKPGEKVTADTPEALHRMPAKAPRNRLGLASWVVDPANPLTARVTVNRFWQEVFGQGIVATPEDFGVMGAAPSHPELLDWLAIEFRENGWNVQQLFKLMLMSATYRQSAVVTAEKIEQDRHNRLLSRGPRFRMDAEMVRDHALAASGLLAATMYGPGVKPYQPGGIWDIVGLPGGNTRNYVQDKGENLYRRTLYTFWKRMAPPPNLEAFNATSREVCTVRRERTNTPLQALVTLNDPQFVEAARHLAQQALGKHAGNDSAILDFIMRRVVSRPAGERERTLLQADKAAYLAYYQAHTDDAQSLVNVGESAVNQQREPAQLAAWTMVCNQVMNFDEALNK